MSDHPLLSLICSFVYFSHYSRHFFFIRVQTVSPALSSQQPHLPENPGRTKRTRRPPYRKHDSGLPSHPSSFFPEGPPSFSFILPGFYFYSLKVPSSLSVTQSRTTSFPSPYPRASLHSDSDLVKPGPTVPLRNQYHVPSQQTNFNASPYYTTRRRFLIIKQTIFLLKTSRFSPSSGIVLWVCKY